MRLLRGIALNILLIIRPELFSILVMLFLLLYDRFCAGFRGERKNAFFPFALTCLGHCVMALVTEITVNSPEVPAVVNDVCHVLFFLFSLLYSLFYLDYAVDRIMPDSPYRKKLLTGGLVLAAVCIAVMLLSPIEYLQGNGTKYSAGIGPTLCYALGFVYVITADVAMIVYRKQLPRDMLLAMLPLSVVTLGLMAVQIVVPEFLFTAESLTGMTLGVFFAIENPVAKFREQSFRDAYLQVWSRNGYEYDIEHIISERKRRGEPLIGVIADVNNLKTVNDSLSHAEGDRLLEDTAKALREHLTCAYKIYRIGGDEFAAFCFTDDINTVAEQLRAVTDACAGLRQGIPVGLSVGWALVDSGETLIDAQKRADAMMYDRKRAFYRETGFERRR